MSWHEIPLDNTPDQEFHITVEANEKNIPLIMRLRYNTEGNFWHMDISDGNTGKMMISNVPLVTGQFPAADMMRQFQHMGIGSAIILNVTDKTAGNIPGMFDLGTDFILLWGSGDIE